MNYTTTAHPAARIRRAIFRGCIKSERRADGRDLLLPEQRDELNMDVGPEQRAAIRATLRAVERSYRTPYRGRKSRAAEAGA